MQVTPQEHLARFAQIADPWLDRATFMRKYPDFFRDFVDPDKLASADWPYFQRLGGHIHAFQSMSLARASALGRPNHPIERYREAFLDLAHGPDDAETRIRRFTDPETKLKRFGDSAMSEIIGTRSWTGP